MKILVVCFFLSITTVSHAKNWSFNNCQTGLVSFHTGAQFAVQVSLQFSSLTGLGHGKAQVDNQKEVKMECKFMTEPTYGIGPHAKNNEFIICETVEPVLENMKLGIPIHVYDNKGSIKGENYIQLENGNFGHGALDFWACS